ncbi:zinc-ribbon domain-containing protein [Halovenus amylolytica]|uniref:zinc ribbon domain-containing protein n=1 Tax=Halovenus amylolytica TaxID=2500550 RepID=UPI002FC41FEE
MPYCTNCGEEVTDEQRYCSYCGEPVGGGNRRDNRPREQATPDRDQSPPERGQPAADDRQPEPASGAGRQQSGHQQAGPRTGPATGGRARDVGPRTGTVELYVGSLRRIFSHPLPLLAIFVAWFVFSAQILLAPTAALLVSLLSGVLGLVAAGVLYLRTDAELTGEEVPISAAYAEVFGAGLSLLVVWLVYVIALSVGLALFILPGLYLGGRLLLAFPACVLDGEGAIESLKTSWQLTSPVSLKPIGFLLLAFVTLIGLTLVLVIPQAVTLGIFGVELPAVETVETIEDALDIFDNPRYILINSFYQAIALAIPVGAVQIAATRLYREQRPAGEPSRRDGSS